MDSAEQPHGGEEAELDQLIKSVEEWRRTRPHLGAMPTLLWDGAIAAAGSLGVTRVAQALKLNHTVLKRRLELTHPEQKSRTKQRRRVGRPAPTNGFIELSGIPLPSNS